MEDMMRLSRIEGVPEYVELDLRVNRMTCTYLMDALRARTISSLLEHIQSLVLHILTHHHALNDAREQQQLAALHLPSSIKALNTALGVTAEEDVGLAKDLLLLPLEESSSLVEGEGWVQEQFIDLKVRGDI